MKILLVNTYFFLYGGAERCFFDTSEILKEHGHEVIHFAMEHPKNFSSPYANYFVSYFPPLRELNLLNKIKLFFRFFYNFEARNKFRKLLYATKPDVVHIHIIDYKISHAIICEAKKHKIPVVMTLHDLRILCPQLAFLSKGEVCEKCMNGALGNCISNKCIEGSIFKSMLLTLFYYFNSLILKSWRKISVFISPSLFLMNKVKTSRAFGNINIIHLSHSIDFSSHKPNYSYAERYIVYFGRLSKEKGLGILLDAVKGLDINLKIIGSGKYEGFLKEKAKKEQIENVSFLGHLEMNELYQEVKRSMFSISPSICYESFGYTIVESFLLGKTVVASNLGAFPELIKDNETGLLFTAGDSNDLRNKINTLIQKSQLSMKYGKNARLWIENNFNKELFYNKLMSIYNQSIDG